MTHFRRAVPLTLAAFGVMLPAQFKPPITRHATPPATHYNNVAGPVPTNRFWAAKNWFPLNKTSQGGAYTMFPEPLALQTTSEGLLVGYSHKYSVDPAYFIHPVQTDLTLGVAGLHATSVPISAYSDWTVDFHFGPITTRVGRGMPFVYAETDGADPTVTFNSPPRVFRNRGNLLGVTIGENSYGLFCPANGSWAGNGTVFTCHLPPGKHYLSLALLPSPAAFEDYAKVAFVFPKDTQVTWSYDQHRSMVETRFKVVTEVKEGRDASAEFLQALYPHQYSSLSPGALNTVYTYASARGTLKVIHANEFVTQNIYHGILPYLPLTGAADLARERDLLHQVAAESTHYAAADTYGKGKALNRIAQLLPLAGMAGAGDVQRQLATSLRKEFERWAAPGDRAASLFQYNQRWGTVLGYPDSYGSVEQLNDHHFHYGYWIHSAALLELYDPTWANSVDAQHMVRSLVGDIATLDRDDRRFPMLRNFDAFAGHSWASGQAPFGDGQNQESSSEAVNAWAGLILYAEGKRDIELRDAAIWMYTLETNAAFDYWFNAGPVPTFPEGFQRTQISNLFDGKADAATWFGKESEFEHGIQFLPFTGGSLYLGRNPAYSRTNFQEAMRDSSTHIDGTGTNWPDLMAMYQAFYDPDAGFRLWQRTSYVFDGESKAHEFAWLRSMDALGTVDPSVTADTPLYAVFRKNGRTVHLAFNMQREPVEVSFSDGTKLQVSPRTMASDAVAAAR